MSTYLTFAHALADAAAIAIRPHFGQPLAVDAKADNSPVSIADREAEAAIRALIEKHHPDHGIFGEEHGVSGADKKYVWVIDPIDGTRAFLAGSKEWGTLIALCEDGIPILGILNQPITEERWVGERDGAASYSIHEHSRKNEEPMTHACPSLSAARISTTSADYFTVTQAMAYVALAKKCGKIFENGDCYAYGLLARGHRDLVVDAGLKPYDILALVPIVEAAGGHITDWKGNPITLSNYGTAIAAGDGGLHKEALAILQSAV